MAEADFGLGVGEEASARYQRSDGIVYGTQARIDIGGEWYAGFVSGAVVDSSFSPFDFTWGVEKTDCYVDVDCDLVEATTTVYSFDYTPVATLDPGDYQTEIELS